MAGVGPSPILRLIRQAVEDRGIRDLPDRELLRRFHAQRDQAAFLALVRRHGPMVLHICRDVLANEADAEDAFQATFLIFACKAGSIRKTASPGSWLHGVAYRTALKARARSAARQKHEARVPVRRTAEPDDLNWREVRQVLHEELDRLPERYRAPLVLCYLEGATQEAAARQLSLAKSTLREHLERGQALLRSRLLRRGLGPAALLVAAAWPAADVAAGGAPALTASLARVASRAAAGQAATSVLSGNVTKLTEEVLKTMFLSKSGMTRALFLLAVLVCFGVGVLTLAASATGQAEPAGKAERAANGAAPAAGGADKPGQPTTPADGKPLTIQVRIDQVNVDARTIAASCLTARESDSRTRPLRFENLAVSPRAGIRDHGKGVRFPDLKPGTTAQLELQAGELGFVVVGIEVKDRHFTDVTAAAGVAAKLPARGIESLEYDGDGYLDLFLAYPNEGRVGKGVAVGDFNNDGWADLFLFKSAGGVRVYRNNGNGTFTEVTRGLPARDAIGETITIDGGKVEIAGESIKVEGGKVKIIRRKP